MVGGGLVVNVTTTVEGLPFEYSFLSLSLSVHINFDLTTCNIMCSFDFCVWITITHLQITKLDFCTFFYILTESGDCSGYSLLTNILLFHMNDIKTPLTENDLNLYDILAFLSFDLITNYL